jgi:hypothetical protein
MPRQITIPSAEYTPQTIEHTLDQFNPVTDTLRVRLTRESWPGTNEDNVVRVTITWNTGGGAWADFPGGVVTDRLGNTLPASVIEADVPVLAVNGVAQKRNVVSAVVKIEVFQTLTTEIDLEAV